MHGPRIPSLPTTPADQPAAPEIKPLTIRTGQAPDGQGGVMVVLEISTGTPECETVITGALHPKTAAALGVELQKLGSAGQLVISRAAAAS